MLLMIAVVAASWVADDLRVMAHVAHAGKPPHHFAADKERRTAKAEPHRTLASKIKSLIRKNAANREIVGFFDGRRHAVQVVRGTSDVPGQAAPRQNSETVTFADQRMRPVRVLRGAPVVAAVSLAPSSDAAAPPGPSVQTVYFASRRHQPVTVLRGGGMIPVALDLPALARSPSLDLFAAAGRADLDRIAFAVDGAESSHGADPRMWRPALDGPQGPMQVSAAAAIDSGGGDRFDLIQNRQLGRAYLARLYRRYGNWPDAVAAYNWGPGNMDIWIAQGRPEAGLPLEVERYRLRVLRDGGIAQAAGSPAARVGWPLSPP